jgi:hypothetical protein
MSGAAPIRWPDGKKFAFAITDDTDGSSLDKIRPVYDVLLENGILPTKTVWPLRALGRPVTGGQCLEDDRYAEWIRTLARQGVEIALHGTADESSPRERIIKGFERFFDVVGYAPQMHINHVGQTDALYWDANRVDPPLRWIYQTYCKFATHQASSGHVPTSPYFWGDICRERIKYVRNYTWYDINTLKADPLMPYFDPARPYVRYWFSATHASGLRRFIPMFSESNQDRLLEEGGCCIVYTHLGKTFYPLSAEFKRLIKRLGSMPGWFAPASVLLDYIGRQRGFGDTSERKRAFQNMQWRWVTNHLHNFAR